MNGFKKFLRVVDGHVFKNCLMTFLALVSFSIHEILKKDQKMTGSKKVVITKNQFFHTRQPQEGIF